jgi:hypothetical protein
MTRVSFKVGGTVVEAELLDTPTAAKVVAALPINSSGSYWGGEFYFPVPVKSGYEPGATDVVDPGTVVFWVEGSCLCLLWGPTPMSRGGECRLASRANIVGRVTNPEVLSALKGDKVRVELY